MSSWRVVSSSAVLLLLELLELLLLLKPLNVGRAMIGRSQDCWGEHF
jgi:hypothetical protein